MKIERIYYKHYRYFDNEHNENILMRFSDTLKPYTRGEMKWQPTCKGGLTECHLILTNSQDIVGIAECSLKDNFNYRLGRAIAYGRAMKKYIALQKAHISAEMDVFYQ